MNIDTKEFFSVLPLLAKKPAFTIALVGLAIPVVLLMTAPEFASSSLEALIFFAVLGVSSLAYSAFLATLIIKQAKKIRPK